MNVKYSAVLVLAFFAAGPACPQGEGHSPGVSFSAGYWMSAIRAEAEYEGDRFSLEDDLSMSPRNDAPVLRLDLSWSEKSGVSLGSFSLSYGGADSIRRDIKFGGVTFPAGAEVGYRMGMSFTDVLYRGRLASFQGARADILFGARVADLSLELAGIDEHPGVYRRIKEEFTAPAPLAGMAISGGFPRGLGYEIRAAGFALPVEGYRFNMLDADLALHMAVHENFLLGAGYRFFYVNADVDAFKFKSSLDGFMLRGVFRY